MCKAGFACTPQMNVYECQQGLNYKRGKIDKAKTNEEEQEKNK